MKVQDAGKSPRVIKGLARGRRVNINTWPPPLKSTMSISSDKFDIVERLGVTMWHFRNVKTKEDGVLWLLTTVKLFHSDSIIMTAPRLAKQLQEVLMKRWDDLFSSPVQGPLDVDTVLLQLRTAIDPANDISKWPIVQKFSKLLYLLLVHGFLSKSHLEFLEMDFESAEKIAYAKTAKKQKLVLATLDAVVFTCESVRCYQLTGEWSTFVHGPRSYADWFKRVDLLANQVALLSHPEPHGFTRSDFLKRLEITIEDGVSITKFGNAVSFEAKSVRAKLGMLYNIRSRELCRDAAMKSRRAPFGVLVHGGTSVGKSIFSEILHAAMAEILNEDASLSNRYVREGFEEYWNNFKSYMWSIIFDDAGKFSDNVIRSDGDNQIKELISVLNDQPFSTPQADLADKGMAPCLARFVMATSNFKDMRANMTFSFPVAALRRFHLIVKLTVKDRYCREGMLAKDLIPPPVEGRFPDFWNIDCFRVRPNASSPGNPDYVHVSSHTSIESFLDELKCNVESWDKNYIKKEAYTAEIFGRKLCEKCGRYQCICPERSVQSDTEVPFETNLTTVDTSWHEFMYFTKNGPWNHLSYYIWIFVLGLLWFLWYVFLALAALFPQHWVLMVIGFVSRSPRVRSFVFWYLRKMGDDRMSHRAYLYLLPHINAMHPVLSTVVVLLRQFAIGYVVGKGIAGLVKWAVPTETEPRSVSAQSGDAPGEVEDSEEVSDDSNIAVQGASASIAQDGRADNVWFNRDLVETGFNFPPASACMKGQSAEHLLQIAQRNLVCLTLSRSLPDGRRSLRDCRGLFVCGHYLLVPGHFWFSEWDTFEIRTTRSGGVTPNVVIARESLDWFVPKHPDLVMVYVTALPPFKDLLPWWVDGPLRDGQRASMFQRDRNGNILKHHIKALLYCEDDANGYFPMRANAGCGYSDEPTPEASCGSIVITEHPRGPVFTGFHYWGGVKGNVNPLSVRHWFITRGEIENWMSQHSKRPPVQAGVPKLDMPTACIRPTAVHYKHPIRFFPEGSANVLGGCISHRSSRGSEVVETPIAKRIGDDFQFQQKFGAPIVGGREAWKPYRWALIDLVKAKSTAKSYELKRVTAQLSKFLVEDNASFPKADVVVLTDYEAVNGIPGVAFVDSLNRKSSMGSPWNTTKEKFQIDSPTDGYPDGIMYTQEIMDEVRRIEVLYRSGVRAHPVFKDHLKDEARELKKCSLGKTRVFSGGSGPWCILVRKYLLSFVRMVQLQKYEFMSAPGTVCQSVEWDDMWRYLTHNGLWDKIIAGDYKAYDKGMGPEWILASCEVIVEVLRSKDWPETDLLVVWGIFEDIAYALHEFDGSLIEFYGSNPSGHPLTVILNCIVNVLYIMYAYQELNPMKTSEDFREHVRLITYGDDNAMGVSEDIPWFTQAALTRELAKIGVVYTMPDKSEAAIDYLPIDQLTFLKRSWRFDRTVGRYLCPLEEESIFKSLTLWIPSREVPPQKQMIDIISSAVREYFWYGESLFRLRRAYFMQLSDEVGLTEYVEKSTFPSYEELLASYRDKDSYKSTSKYVG